MLKEGLYEQIINRKIAEEIKENSDNSFITEFIDQRDSSVILSNYLRELIKTELDNVIENNGNLNDQINLVNNFISKLGNDFSKNHQQLVVDQKAEQLLAIIKKENNHHLLEREAAIVRPQTSIAVSSLFTGAIYEPQMFNELKKEIISANKIDMLVSFIKWSGLRLIIDELTQFTNNGGTLRVITTSYMGATDVKAIDKLSKLKNTTVKVSYDTERTRLHAKAYIFYRETGFTTAYVGSSNMSNAALSSGLEWNIKVTQKDQSQTIEKINQTFNSYFKSSEYEYYDEGQKERLQRALNSEKYFKEQSKDFLLFDLKPYSYQQEILDNLAAEREIRGRYKNLVVAATGTGKTVISAFDYKNFTNLNKGSRLLFVAHREEILKQSIYTFRHVLKDSNFGDLFVGSYHPDQIEHLFISIQTFNSQDFTNKTSKDFYDYIIVDEFHHASAPSYQKLLNYYKPKILLGLTATPERSDNENILKYFDNRIAAEIRLPEAINRKLLSTFQYFGVSDDVDLSTLRWTRGGYDKTELSNIYTSGGIAHQRAIQIANLTNKYVTDINKVIGLGFCVSVEHAEFMTRMFNEFGISSISLTGKSTSQERTTAKSKLLNGEVKFIFVVDIYNEGVDIPEINTILFLRPTESLTIFIQQLGRGLRISENKECLTVLDFVGQSNRSYNFEEKFKALLFNDSPNISKEVSEGFTSLPKGCYIQLEKKARQYILDNIDSSFRLKNSIILKIKNFEEETGKRLSLENFIDHYHLDIRTIYSKYSFSRLSVIADCANDFDEELEEVITKSFSKFCMINSRRFIKFINEILTTNKTEFDEIEERMLEMFHITIFIKPYKECGCVSLLESLNKVKLNPIMCEEILSIVNYNYQHIDFVDENIDLGFLCPLDLHCNYTRDQILVAMDYLNPSTVREGVKYLKDKNIDIFFITLNKDDKDYSPTTLYNDYSINDVLFHWQSQSTTSDTSVTGRRYINHHESNTKILLFVREFKNDRILKSAAVYTYLGEANYVSHEGSRPMNITWELNKKIPAKYLKKTNKLIIT